MDIKLKQAIETIMSIYEVYDEDSYSVRIDMALFMCYLSASDGIITPEECETITFYTGLRMNPEELGQLIEQSNIYSDEFDQEVPFAFRILVAADNQMIEEGVVMKQYSSELLLEIYKGLAFEVINADGKVNVDEELDTIVLLNTMQLFVKQNLNKDGIGNDQIV